MSRSWDIPETMKFIKEKEEENERLMKGMFGCAIKHFLLNQKSIAAGRKLLRIQKGELYQDYLKTKSNKTA